jgi:two-component system sensor histidine kinase BaeS
MTRRLVVLLVGLVTTTLLVAGLATLVIANVRARATTEESLRERSEQVASNIGELFDASDGVELNPTEERQRLRQLTLLRRLLDLDGFAVLTIDRAGRIDAEELPTELPTEVFDVELLRSGSIQSGNVGDLVFAAAPLDLPAGRTGVIVLSQDANAGLGPAFRYFVLAATLTALLGLLAALITSRRFVQPITAASDATARIAAGELSTRLDEPAPTNHDELAELARNVNRMAAALERSRTLEQQFLLSVSHDLRTPLTSIRGYAEALADGAGDPRHAADVIRSEARRLERLVADLLDLAKLQASSFSVQSERVDLAQLARVTVDGFTPEAEERSLRLDLDVPATPVHVWADHDRLAQVAANLIENATKYATSRIVVSVSHVSGAQRAELRVRDDGPGIDPADLPHVFERLYVARRRPVRHESSSGLGLAIVHQLVAAMAGEVRVDSTVGDGTTFVVTLPRHL